MTTAIGAFGPLSATVGGRRVDLGSPIQRTLLAVLLCRPGRGRPADELIDAVWDGRPPRSAASNLRSCVGRLRRVLGPDAVILDGRSGYRLNGAVVVTDIGRFQQLRAAAGALSAVDAEAARDLLTEAVLLRRERPFCGVAPVPVIRAEADRLEDDWLSAVEKRAHFDLAAGRSAEIVGELARAAELHPYRERLAEQLMLALYRSGRQTEALAAYRRITAALAADLVVRPGPRLIDLHRAILCQRPELITSS